MVVFYRGYRHPIQLHNFRYTTGGTRQLCRGRKSYRTTYTFTDGTTAEMAVVATLTPNKEKRLRRKWLLFVLIGLD